jgi:hypothetical protein
MVGWHSLGIIAWVFGVTAIILAVLALGAIRKSGNRGRALAGWGLGLGIGTLVFDLLVMMTAVAGN